MKLRVTFPTAEILVLGSAILAAAGQLSIKLGLGHHLTLWTRTLYSVPFPLTLGVLSGLAIYGTGTLLWVLAISRREISYLYPLGSLNYIIAALCGHFILNEPLLLERWIGIGIMSTGIVLLTCSAPKTAVSSCT